MPPRSLLALVGILALSACARSAGAQGAASEALARNPASANDGERIYTMHCASCHQSDGRGVPGAFPPLANNPFVTGPPAPVIAAVKFGTSGKRVVGGETYDGEMPRWEGSISDDDIAAVVTFLRTNWHNDAGAVSVADVRSVSR